MMALLLKLVGGSQLAANVIVVLLCLIVSLIVWGSGYSVGKTRANAQCQTAALEAENKALRKSMEVEREIARAANDRAVKDAAEVSTLREQVEDLTDAFDQQDDACTLSPDDARRLRNIR